MPTKPLNVPVPQTPVSDGGGLGPKPYGMAPTKPLAIGPNGQSTGVQQDAQSRIPFRPNNGNPGGANNMPSAGPAPLMYGAGPGSVNYRNVRGGRPFNQDIHNYRMEQANQQAFAANQYQVPRQGLPMAPSPNLQGPPGGGLNNGMGTGVPTLPNTGFGFQGQNSGFRGVNPNQLMRDDPTTSPQQINWGYNGGQNPYLGRYRPPTMNGSGWNDQGGYSYNLPNAFGPYPNYGMGPYGYGY